MALALIFDSAGFGEWFVLLAVVLVAVGPRRLPAAARKIGSISAKIRRAADGFRRQLMEMEDEFDRAAKLPEGAAKDSAKEAAKGAAAPFSSVGDESTVIPPEIG